jgi:hypothetical protein
MLDETKNITCEKKVLMFGKSTSHLRLVHMNLLSTRDYRFDHGLTGYPTIYYFRLNPLRSLDSDARIFGLSAVEAPHIQLILMHLDPHTWLKLCNPEKHALLKKIRRYAVHGSIAFEHLRLYGVLRKTVPSRPNAAPFTCMVRAPILLDTHQQTGVQLI